MSKPKALIFDLSGSVSFGRLSLLGKVLFPMLLLKSDDQGRGLAEADAIKWKVCPNVAELTIEVIGDVLDEMSDDKIDLLHLYLDSRNRMIYQFKRWWTPDIGSGSCLQWARPSEYEAPQDWVDRIRIQQGPGKPPLVENWDKQGGFCPSELPNDIPNQVPNELPEQEHGGQYNLTKPKVTQSRGSKDILGADAPPAPESPPPDILADYELIRQVYIEHFPNKPEPRATNKTLQGKVKTRMKSAHFRDNWQAALERASESQFIHNGGWFDLGWFLKNDTHYEKCLNGNYDRGQGRARDGPPDKELPAALRREAEKYAGIIQT